MRYITGCFGVLLLILIVVMAQPSNKPPTPANENKQTPTDRAGDPPTQYTYDPNHPHYLKTVVDPLGVQQLQTSYDTTGRTVTVTLPPGTGGQVELSITTGLRDVSGNHPAASFQTSVSAGA